MTEVDEVYTLYFKDVYRYVFSLCRNETVAEDITQETFFKALKSIDGFKGNCKMRVWLCQIAKNTYYTLYARDKKAASVPDEQSRGVEESFEQRLVDKEGAFEIHKALHGLEEPYKEVFSLRLFGELSYAQIAELFGKTESWARVTYHRAKAKLKEDLL